jgi:25S rRNA (uracil2843-N3)-methyltransferase
VAQTLSQSHGSMVPKGNKNRKAKQADRPKINVSTTASSQTVAQSKETPKLPLELQQLVLNIFSDALPVSGGENFKQTIQDVKGHFYNRDFASAFGTEHYLRAYALRWSASRALAFADILAGLDVKDRWPEDDTNSTILQGENQRTDRTEILCIGGGAGAEVVSLAALASHFSLPRFSITAIDIADWSSVLSKLNTAIVEPPALSPYASAAKRDANRALLDSQRFSVDFKQQDILECAEDELTLLLGNVSFVTVMFTLNELFSTSIAKTTSLLLKLTEAAKAGTWLLVVDSPGSYSEVTLGAEETPKRYPMKWLLDHTLQQVAGTNSTGNSKWKKLVEDDSRWFRIIDHLRHPIELESMRYQIHLYQRQGSNE